MILKAFTQKKDYEDSFNGFEEGFTLIELLIVMIIISMLAAFVGPRMFKKLGKAKSQAAEGQIHLFEMALDTYRLDTGEYPNTLQELISGSANGWDGPYLKKRELPKDPWGNEYRYSRSGDEYTLESYGADGQPGGEGEDKDISSAGYQTESRMVITPG